MEERCKATTNAYIWVESLIVIDFKYALPYYDYRCTINKYQMNELSNNLRLQVSQKPERTVNEAGGEFPPPPFAVSLHGCEEWQSLS